ncbi:peptidoglycan bridge formation glycyltransferase FemA/FemB family protein [Candidatus Microgenomates bacterium]|nr:peptidoglycan bridge formation glycyltransferase FemA/FemB family protein [Candidatus Microgenomates bacterium]
MLKITVIKDKKKWEGFLLSQSYQPFFQSWSWGEVQERLGHRVWRLGIYEGRKMVGICQIVEIRARRGNYFHLRHGPLLANFKKQFPRLLGGIMKMARTDRIDFIRMSPLLPEEFDINFLQKQGFRNSPIHNMDAENAWVLDLDKTEEELLKSMRKTTRYLVKKGEKLSLEIIKASSIRELEAFLRLYEKTAQKHGFVPHGGIREEIEVFKKDGQAELFLARYKKKIISGALVIFYGNLAVYHHGATDPKFEHLSPSYLVQWEAIKEAKRRGKKIYNFWGVVPPSKPHHPWQGLTLFKTGFGGRRINFIHAQDLPLSPWYWKTFLIESIIRIRKGY